MDVVEDLAHELRIGSVRDDPQRPAAEPAERDVYFEDAFQARRNVIRAFEKHGTTASAAGGDLL